MPLPPSAPSFRRTRFNSDFVKPHPDAVMVRLTTGEVEPYPEGPKAVASQQYSELTSVHGFIPAVAVVKCATGSLKFMSLETQVAGGEQVKRALRAERTDLGHLGEPAHMLYSEWINLSTDEQKALLAKGGSIRDEARALHEKQAELNAALEEAAALRALLQAKAAEDKASAEAYEVANRGKDNRDNKDNRGGQSNKHGR